MRIEIDQYFKCLWDYEVVRVDPFPYTDAIDFEEPLLCPTQPHGISSKSNNDFQFERNQAPQAPNQNQKHGDFKLKVDILLFDVLLHIEDYLDWE